MEELEFVTEIIVKNQGKFTSGLKIYSRFAFRAAVDVTCGEIMEV
jgi:hypothetical protein